LKSHKCIPVSSSAELPFTAARPGRFEKSPPPELIKGFLITLHFAKFEKPSIGTKWCFSSTRKEKTRATALFLSFVFRSAYSINNKKIPFIK
jgi:hypothetical protein